MSKRALEVSQHSLEVLKWPQEASKRLLAGTGGVEPPTETLHVTWNFWNFKWRLEELAEIA